MTIPNSQRGFTLIELAITLAVLLVLLAIGMPDFGTTNDKRRLQGAAEALQQDLRFARTESIKRNQSTRLSVTRTSDSVWCWGTTLGATTCDCTASDCVIDGVLRITDSTAFDGIKMLSASYAGGVPRTTFNPTHGTAGAGTTVFQSGKQSQGSYIDVSVVLSALGRPIVCDDNISVSAVNSYGFSGCP